MQLSRSASQRSGQTVRWLKAIARLVPVRCPLFYYLRLGVLCVCVCVLHRLTPGVDDSYKNIRICYVLDSFCSCFMLVFIHCCQDLMVPTRAVKCDKFLKLDSRLNMCEREKYWVFRGYIFCLF